MGIFTSSNTKDFASNIALKLKRGALFSLTFLLTISFSQSVLADLTPIVKKELLSYLNKRPNKYAQVTGAICEELAIKKIQERYPSNDHIIESGIAYGSQARTIGELDVVVFRASDMEAIEIIEVKCWRNLKKARSKASKQLNRFKNTMDRLGQFEMWSVTDKSKVYFTSQFDEYPTTSAMAQHGGEQYGFEDCIGFHLRDINELRSDLVRCQKEGTCPN